MPEITVWDKVVVGLHLRTLESGKKAYYLFYRTRQGRQRRPKLGNFSEITVGEARRRARTILSRVSAGEDPKGDWDRAKSEITIAALFQATWKGHWNQSRYIVSGWAPEVNRAYQRHIAQRFGFMKISDLTTVGVSSWHTSLRRTPISANRALEVLSKMYRYAAECGWAKFNPCEHVKAFTEKKRTRFATEEEIQRIGSILERQAKAYPRAAAFLYVLILTGARPRYLERARLEDLETFTYEGKSFGKLSLGGKMTAKTGDNDVVLVPPRAMEILRALPKMVDGSLFGIKMPRKLWLVVRKEAGCEDLWARDWRRTFASVGLSNGLNAETIGELLNQRSAQTTKRYAKLDTRAKVEGVGQIADKLDGLLCANDIFS